MESPKKINAESLVFAEVPSSSTMNWMSMVLDVCSVDHELDVNSARRFQ